MPNKREVLITEITGMFVLRSSISVRVIKKIFGKLNKREGRPNKQYAYGNWKKIKIHKLTSPVAEGVLNWYLITSNFINLFLSTILLE